MQINHFGRTWLRAALAAGALFGQPLRADGQTMDPLMSALVRFARTRRGGPPDLGALRKRYASAPSITGMKPDRSVRVTATQAAGMPARRYEPRGGPALADMMFFHGGGFIVGTLDTHDALCRRLSARARLRITSVEYRLAPEHPFPAAFDDAAAAWRWARTQESGPWLIGGDSAGANLAAALAVDGSATVQMLLYPVVDMLHQDGLYPSVNTFSDGYLLTAEGMRECARLLIPAGQDPGDPRLSPIRAELGRASPAVIMTAGFDPLRDQGRAYAAALQKAGVKAHLLQEPSLPHGFADFAGVVPAARQAIDRLAQAVAAAVTAAVANSAATAGRG